jgi:ABC-type transport system involved in multi-copper enzyme maturation permease subunit
VNALRIAGLTFREALRRKALYGAIALTLAFLALYAWGTGLAVDELFDPASGDPTRRSAESAAALAAGIDIRNLIIAQLLLAGLYAVSNIAALLAIFMAASTIAAEVEQGTLHALLAKPVARWQVVLGKWLGGSAMLAIYVTVTCLATAGIMYWQSGLYAPQTPLGILLLALKASLLYALTMVGSAFAPTIATGIAMFILYVVANVAGLVELIGHLAGIETMVKVGVITGLVIPSDALWRMVAGVLQPPLNVANPLAEAALRTIAGPFGAVNPPSAWMGLYSLAYVAAALGITTFIFSRRDL